MQATSTEAIKECKQKFNYCSLCHRFRQVCCHLGGKPVCPHCTSMRQLILIEPSPQPKEVKKRMRHRQDEPLKQLTANILEALKDGCFSSKELYATVGKNHYKDYDSFVWFLRSLYKKGEIISCRWLASGPNYYSLPGQEEILYKRTGRPPEERVIKLLEEVKALGISKIARQVGLSRASVYALCLRIQQRTGKVKMQKALCGQVIAYLDPDIN